MYWRFYSLVGFVFLLGHHLAVADETISSARAQSASIMIDATHTGLLFPARDFFFFTQNDRANHPSRLDRMSAYKLAYHPVPRPLVLPALVHDLLSPLLPRLTSRDPPISFVDKTAGHHTHAPWPSKHHMPASRIEQVWRVVPVETQAQAHDPLAMDGDMDLGLEVRAGGTKKEQATNSIKGMASSRFTLLPTGLLEHRIRRYLSLIGADSEVGDAPFEQLQLGLMTNGAYAINPRTKVVTPTGEAIGTLSWTPTTPNRFTYDPWRIVAFRWLPSLSFEGRGFMGEAKKQAEANRTPLDTLTGSLRGDVRLDFLSPQLAATANYLYRQRLTDTQTKWEQASVSLKYQLSHNVSLGGSFTHGKKTPYQAAEHGLALEMGVRF